jgi:hypothetical protein
VASTHHTAHTIAGVRSSELEIPITVSVASSVADAPLSSTVARRKSPKRTGYSSSALSRSRTPSVPSTSTSACSSISRGVSSERTPTRSA